MISRPEPAEYAPYYSRYLNQVTAEPDVLALLRRQPAELQALLAGVSDEAAAQPTAPGKWSLKQILQHMIDTERVFAYRTLALARGEQAPLPSFEQDDYVSNSGAHERTLASLLHEHAVQRVATLMLVEHLPTASLTRVGTAAGHAATARALVWITAAHELHHHRLLQALGFPRAGT